MEILGQENPVIAAVREVPFGMPQPPGLPLPAQRIGQYELIRELGRGGMGAVFLARDLKLGRRVAIKFLHTTDAQLNARFILEARATAHCSHENIVVIHEVGEHQNQPFMVLEYLQGAPLSKRLQFGRPIPPAHAVELMLPVVRALVCAHEHNIVHRDLKPDNIVVTDAGTVKVLDFGIAKLLHGASLNNLTESEMPAEQRMAAVRDHLAHVLAGPDDVTQRQRREAAGSSPPVVHTKKGALVGTLPYMSPEQWGADTVDHRTDIWAVGVILFKMVAGRHPLEHVSGMGLMITGVLSEPMPSVRAAAPDIPDELAEIIDHSLIKRKDERIDSARQLGDRLQSALEVIKPGRISRKLHADQSPYPGLSVFQESDTHRFFGRNRDIAAAVARLRDQPMLGVVGPSGVGKSSFVRAGVVPALKESGTRWALKVIRPGREPLAAMGHMMAPMLIESADALTSTTVAADVSQQYALIARLAREPGYLGTVLRSWARKLDGQVLLFVDQCEELYTLCNDRNERRAFTACLASAADDATSPLRVVVSIRSDFLDRVPEDQHFMAELSRGLYFLAPPNRDGLRDALVQPAEMAGHQFESTAMVENILDHLEHIPGALPLLQFAASTLWRDRDRQCALLTEASYRALGGIAGALAGHADACLRQFPSTDQPLIRAIFLRLVTPERTRAMVSMGELHALGHGPQHSSGAVQRIVDQLVCARLLVIQTQAQFHTGNAATESSQQPARTTVEIVHESLLHTWPTLRRWLDETQEDAAFLEQLRQAAKNWQAKNFATDLVWRGEAMEEARRFARRCRGELPQLQRAYLDAVFALAARASRRKRRALVAIISTLSLMVAAAAVALVLIRDAQRQAARQAAAAHAAEQQVRAQLAATQAARRAEERALQEAKDASRHKQRTYEELLVKQRQLEDTVQLAIQAQETALRAKMRAVQNARAAQAANQSLQIALQRESERRQRLESQLRWRWIDRALPLRGQPASLGHTDSPAVAPPALFPRDDVAEGNVEDEQ